MMRRSLSLTVLLAGLLPLCVRAYGDPEATRTLLAALQSGTNLHDRARACQQLGARGTAEAVPALAALLSDPQLAAYARSGLEGIGGAEAAAALRSALGNLKGDLLAGAVDSLGSLRDAAAVGPLVGLAGGSDPVAARAALRSLGRIGGAEAVGFLRKRLQSGPAELRADAAAACLLAADGLLRAGGDAASGDAAARREAVALFDAIRTSEAAAGLRAAATRGAIAARGAGEAAALFLETMRSADAVLRNAALLAVREIPGDAMADALRAAFEKADPGLRAQLIAAMLDCRNDRTMPAVRAAAADPDAGVRLAALQALAKAGNSAEDAAVLAAALSRDGAAEEHAFAADGLVRIGGAEADAVVRKALAAAANPEARVRWIQVAGARAAAGTTAALLPLAGDGDDKVAMAALRALKNTAGPADLQALMKLTRAARTPALRTAAEAAVHGACVRSDGPACADTVLGALVPDAPPADKCSWIRILAALGDAGALPALRAAAGDPDDNVALCALEQLGQWPDPAPAPDLLAVVESGASPRRRAAAFASAARLAGAAAAGARRPDTVVADWFQRLRKAAQHAGDKRIVLAGLGRFASPEGLRLLVPYLDDPEVRTEAAWAVVGVSAEMNSPADREVLRDALRKASAKEVESGPREKAAARLRNVPAPAAQPLFDGQSLAGWEGATNVWRVRDGSIVGGSMDGNPRNEFLTAARPYTNFALRLEYRLTGTEGFVNGGVQFRSVRVAKPPNEMSGYQADIGAGHSGCLYDESRRNKFLARGTDEQIRRLEKLGDWNRLEVRCEGPRIRILLNGEMTVDHTEMDAAIPREGLVALQIHGNCKAEIAFRNIAILQVAE